ncbi:hypothetical protein OSB04_001329 [Centaurea solstitialis]|uniref:MBD domain-containing protein n=1 Tax=Centaurea solstitialis TaxID=347529 RepID=A0AA38TQS8_9ASTR|nr:hypothetical protein OSB04_001329 [Centaurea solstitialis]
MENTMASAYANANGLLQVSPTNMEGTPKFTLPKGWSVQKVRRKGGFSYDKYYRDPETGRQFRSLKEVERYITEGNSDDEDTIVARGKNSGSQDMIVVGGKMLDLEEEDEDNQYQLVNVSPPAIISPTSSFKLPDGWVVEEIPRKNGGYVDKLNNLETSTYLLYVKNLTFPEAWPKGKVLIRDSADWGKRSDSDSPSNSEKFLPHFVQYYHEPGTGQRFRSMVAVQKHLEQLEENSPLSVVLEEMRENMLPLSKAFKLSNRIKDHGSYSSWKQSTSRKEKISSFADPPSKINWVIAGAGGGAGGDAWNAYEDDTLVPDSMKQQWGKTFMMAINNSKT